MIIPTVARISGAGSLMATRISLLIYCFTSSEYPRYCALMLFLRMMPAIDRLAESEEKEEKMVLWSARSNSTQGRQAGLTHDMTVWTTYFKVANTACFYLTTTLDQKPCTCNAHTRTHTCICMYAHTVQTFTLTYSTTVNTANQTKPNF